MSMLFSRLGTKILIWHLRFSRLRKPTDVMAPASWFYLGFIVVPALLIIFRPTLIEFIAFNVVDVIAMAFFKRIDTARFLRKYPQHKLYFPRLSSTALEQMGATEVATGVSSIAHFAHDRSLHCVLTGFVKTLPATAVVVFYWDSPYSYLDQFLLYSAYFLFMQSCFYSFLYFDSLGYASRTLRRIHRCVKLDPAQLNNQLQLTSLKNSSRHELISLISVFGSIALFQTMIFVRNESGSSSSIAIPIATTTLLGAVLVGRTWWQSRQLIQKEMSRLFRAFSNLDSYRPKISPFPRWDLARFGDIFNRLSDRLAIREKEVANLMLQQSEESRTKALGEISALIVHDLSGPLHAIQYSVDVLKKTEPQVQNELQKYYQQLDINTQRSLELVDAIRKYIREPSGGSKLASSFSEVHQSVCILLATHFQPVEFRSIRIQLEDSLLAAPSLAISQSDLIHVLYNIYRNSIENMLKLPPSAIRQLVVRYDQNLSAFEIEDSGSGLSPTRFEELTSSGLLPNRSKKPGRSMGLRLTRGLIERLGGRLWVGPEPTGRDSTAPGTRLRLFIPHAGQESSNSSVDPAPPLS